jgi:hypothetical protein
MAVLVIIPEDELRWQARDLLGPGGSLRAADYLTGAVLAEQNFISDAILWSEPGLDRQVLHAITRLRQLYRDVRIFIVTSERTKGGSLGYIENLLVDGYGLESELPRIVEAIKGVPSIVEKDQAPPTAKRGSSAAVH